MATSRGIHATTIIEFFSFSIQRDTPLDDSFLIYGDIRVTNEYGAEYFLFNRKADNPIGVSMVNGTALLPKPYPGYFPFPLPERFTVELNLFDKSRGGVVDIIRSVSKVVLDFRDPRNSSYDKELEQVFDCNTERCDQVVLRYTIFPCAVLAAFLELRIRASEPYDDAVSVSIVATTEATDHSVKRVICDVPASAAEDDRVPVIVVPAYSWLIIKPRLVVDGEELPVTQSLAFKPGSSFGEERGEFPVGKWLVQFRFNWVHPLNFDPMEPYVCELYSYDVLSWRVFGCSALVNEERATVTPHSEDRLYLMRDSPYIEVFSVSVASFIKNGPLEVSGTIQFKDLLQDRPAIFMAEKPVLVSSDNNTISLKSQCIKLEDEDGGGLFGICLDLKDGGGHEISKGRVDCRPWAESINYRLCSVVTGQHGYACVHYVFHPQAVAAKVRATLHSPAGSDGLKVSGRIYARGIHYRCSTDYEKRFYRSILFEEDNCCLSSSSELPLCREMVVASRFSMLLLGADLQVYVKGGMRETIKAEALVEHQFVDWIVMLNGERHHAALELEVKWNFSML